MWRLVPRASMSNHAASRLHLRRPQRLNVVTCFLLATCLSIALLGGIDIARARRRRAWPRSATVGRRPRLVKAMREAGSYFKASGFATRFHMYSHHRTWSLATASGSESPIDCSRNAFDSKEKEPFKTSFSAS